MKVNWKEVWSTGGPFFVLAMLGLGFLIGFTIGVNQDDVKITIEGPEVYENVIQRLESIEEIESFRLERNRRGYGTDWDLSVSLRDDVSFYFRDVEDFSNFNEDIDKVEYYVDLNREE